MRAGLTVVALLAAVGLVGWLLWGEGATSPNGGGAEDAPGPLNPADKGPELMGAGEGRPHVPDEIRGRGSVEGKVRRRAEPAAATVELRHVMAFDTANPFKGGAMGRMLERMLDAGISSKEVIARVEAKEDGAFKFSGLAPGIYEVRATAPSGALGLASAALPAHGARVEANIDLPVGEGRLEGRAKFADGKPFRGLVAAMSDQGFAALIGGGNLQPTWTDDEGRFVLAGLTGGAIRVSVMVPGVMRIVAAPITLPYDGEYVLTIDAGGAEAAGQVVAAASGDPIAGATVFGGGGDGETTFAIRSTQADGEGRFTLMLPPGRGGLLVRADGYAPQNVQLRGGAKKDLVVSLQAFATIRGRVVTQADGRPVGGILVLAMPNDGEGMNIPSSATTGDDGSFVLAGVVPGKVAIQAVGSGWVSQGGGPLGGRDFNPNALEVEPGGEREIEIQVTAAASAKGRVTDAAGDPVIGCIVQPGSGGRGGMVAALMGFSGPLTSAVTDAEGAYLLETITPGESYTLTARAPGHPEAKSKPFQAVGGTTHDVDLVFEATRWLDLTVVDAEGGAPVAGATVTLRVKEGGGIRTLNDFMGAASGKRTDTDGRVRLGPLPRGELELGIKADGFVEGKQVAVDGDGTKDVQQTVELKRGLVLAGRVEMPEGVPVAGIRVRVSLKRASGDGRGWYFGRPPVAPDGAFRLADLEHEGDYEVTASTASDEVRYSGKVVAQAGDEDVVVRLTASEKTGGELKVRVLGSDGKPVLSARVKLYQYWGKGRSRTRSSRLGNGTALFDRVEEDAELWVEVFDILGSDHGAVISGPLTGEQKELEVRLTESRQIAGTIVGPNGKGVRGVQIKARMPHPTRSGTWCGTHDTTYTDADGRFTLKELGDYEYSLQFGGPPEFAPVPDQRVRAGEMNLRVTMRAGVVATLTVVDYDGKPVGGGSVKAQPGSADSEHSPHTLHFTTDASGTAKLVRLEPDTTYTLEVSGPYDRKDLNSERIEDWTPADQTIRLTRALSIAGTVSDLKGDAVSNCWVQHRRVGEEHWAGSRQTGEDGRFEVPKLEPGKYELKVHIPGRVLMPRPGSPAPQSDIRVARAGEQDVHLVVDMGETLVVKVEGLPKPSSAGSPGAPYEVGYRSHNATLRAQSAPFSMTYRGVGSDGRVRFRGLKAGVAYTFWITGLPGGHYALARDLNAGGADVVVQVRQGVSLRGRVVSPQGVDLPNLGISAVNADGMQVSGRADPRTGEFVLEGLPAGEWSVQGWGSADQQMFHGTASGSTGSDVVLELKKHVPIR